MSRLSSSADRRSSGELLFASLMADNAAPFWRALTTYLERRLGTPVRVLEGLPWQESEQRLYAGHAHLGVLCGLQYVYSVDRGDVPGIELIAAPVMRAPRYRRQPVYFSEVLVRQGHSAESLADLRGGTWAYNEPTSHSGYAITRYVLAMRGERAGFFGRVIASGAHLRSLELLLEGAIDATAIDSTVLEQELRSRADLAQRIRVIETLGPSPMPPLVASGSLPEAARGAIRSALMSMHLDRDGQVALATGHIERFVPMSDLDYAPIRHMARIANQTADWRLPKCSYLEQTRHVWIPSF